MSETISGLHIGAQVWISRFGTPITEGDVTNAVGEGFVPVPPAVDATELSNGWKELGLVETSEPVFTYKETEYEGFSNETDLTAVQTYNKTTVTRIDKKSYKFTLNEVTREVFELSFSRLAKGTIAYIDVWLYTRLLDSLAEAGDQLLATVLLRGRLKLVNPAKALNDITKAEWQLDIINNPLADDDLTALDAKLAKSN